ncbi:MAG TPA: CBS domain-containing protein [Actinomycetota bacterium]|jgi:CBS domain-containing protein
MDSVRDVMTTDLVTVDRTTTIAEAATAMGTRHVGSALVVEEGRATGIFTERDVLRALASDFDAGKDLVERWMTRDPVAIEVATGRQEALTLMLERGFRHLVVTDGGLLVGIVSLRDLSRPEG